MYSGIKNINSIPTIKMEEMVSPSPRPDRLGLTFSSVLIHHGSTDLRDMGCRGLTRLIIVSYVEGVSARRAGGLMLKPRSETSAGWGRFWVIKTL